MFSCASGHHRPYVEPRPAVRDLAALEARQMSVVDAAGHLTHQTIGRVDYPGFSAAIGCIRFTPTGAVQRRVLINGGIHGNEPAGVEAALRFIEDLARAPDAYPHTAFDVVCLVNPWGWVHDMRRNRDGRDVNRDFASFRTQEARLMRAFLEDRHYDLMLDLHEDPAAQGFYLYQYAHPDQVACRRIIATLRQQGFAPEQNVRMIILKTDDGLIDAPLWGHWYMWLTRQLSLANYYRLNLSRNVFTVETPPRLPWGDRLKIQRTAIDRLIAAFKP